MKALQRRNGGRPFLAGLAILVGLLPSRPALGQVPGLPTAPAAAKGTSATAKGAAQPAAEKTKPAVATSTGPIAVHQQISDQEIRRFLRKFLPKYPGVEKID